MPKIIILNGENDEEDVGKYIKLLDNQEYELSNINCDNMYNYSYKFVILLLCIVIISLIITICLIFKNN